MAEKQAVENQTIGARSLLSPDAKDQNTYSITLTELIMRTIFGTRL